MASTCRNNKTNTACTLTTNDDGASKAFGATNKFPKTIVDSEGKGKGRKKSLLFTGTQGHVDGAREGNEVEKQSEASEGEEMMKRVDKKIEQREHQTIVEEQGEANEGGNEKLHGRDQHTMGTNLGRIRRRRECLDSVGVTVRPRVGLPEHIWRRLSSVFKVKYF